jgi:hypothetical protein
MGDVLQILLGAGIVSVLLTQLFAAWRERQQRLREWDGLLRIVFSEVDLNQRLLRIVNALYHARTPPEGHRMAAGWNALRGEHIYMEAWEATRV